MDETVLEVIFKEIAENPKFSKMIKEKISEKHGKYGRYNIDEKHSKMHSDNLSNMWGSLYSEDSFSKHFMKSEAVELVDEMYHYENKHKESGEHFTMEDAEEIHERFKSIIPKNVNINDLYVAINAQYHDYACLYKSWFGNNIDHKVVEAAICFWLKDEDYDGDKLIEYFRK